MQKYNIGYLPMSADMLHIGHISAILKAKKYCDNLIVGLLSDEAIKKYKRIGPVISYGEREIILKLMTGLPFKVVKQNNINFYDNLKKYNIDVIFSGDGWEEQELQAINKAGCELVEFDYCEYQSTTKIKNRIIKQYENFNRSSL